MQISQQIAALAVLGVIKQQRNLSHTLPAAIQSFPSATPQQKAVGQDLAYNTLRFYAQTQATLDFLASKPILDDAIRSLLLVALAQLQHSEAQTFTVVNQAVLAAAHPKKPWAKGLVNAVLRNFLRQQTEISAQLNGLKMPKKLEAQFNYPHWWITKVQAQFPDDWESILGTGNMHPPMILRVNLRKTTVADYLTLLSENKIAAQYLGEQAILLNNPSSVEKIPYFSEGWVSVQDYGAQLAAPILNPKPGARVLDACAAPGGKTGQLLELFDIQLTALEMDPTRITRIADNLSRLQLNAQLVQGDASKLDWWDGKPFDYILADVPCSASGVVRRHVEMKWLRREADIAQFAAQQSAILQQLWKCLAKGGKLLYVTCSIFYDENLGQISNFLQQNADATLLPILLPQPIESINTQKTDANTQQILPKRAHDGLFYALLQKN